MFQLFCQDQWCGLHPCAAFSPFCSDHHQEVCFNKAIFVGEKLKVFVVIQLCWGLRKMQSHGRSQALVQLFECITDSVFSLRFSLYPWCFFISVWFDFSILQVLQMYIDNIECSCLAKGVFFRLCSHTNGRTDGHHERNSKHNCSKKILLQLLWNRKIKESK